MLDDDHADLSSRGGTAEKPAKYDKSCKRIHGGSPVCGVIISPIEVRFFDVGQVARRTLT